MSSRNQAAKTGLQKPSRQNRAAVAYLAIATVALHRIAVARTAADPVEKSWPPKAGFLLFLGNFAAENIKIQPFSV